MLVRNAVFIILLNAQRSNTWHNITVTNNFHQTVNDSYLDVFINQK